MSWASAPSILRIMPPEMRARFNAVAGERPEESLTGNTLFPLSTTTQPLMTYIANGALQISSQGLFGKVGVPEVKF